VIFALGFLMGLVAAAWIFIGHRLWSYAIYRASGPRGIVFNPTDSKPAAYLGIIFWVTIWPILLVIEHKKWLPWSFKEMF
jgi:hypothetical protein